MKIFKSKIALKKEIIGQKNLSLVPTMGGLHSGHKYLIKKAKKKKGKVIVSIYVNPKQFNSEDDFRTYPRNIKKDINILKLLKVNYIFIPNYNDIFSFKTKKEIFLDKFSDQLCGKTRKSHFKGVVNVVNRFLEIIRPKYLFLGKKDFQQLYLINQHIIKRSILTNIIPCNTVREKNGIACSSRNKMLKYKEILLASKTYKFIKQTKIKLRKKRKFSFSSNKIAQGLKKLGLFKIDYIKCLNVSTLKKPKRTKEKYNIFIAYYLGKTRLIDNI